MILRPSIIVLNSYTSQEPITLETLLNAKERVESKGTPPNIMRVSPKTFHDINTYFQNEEIKYALTTGVIKPKSQTVLFGIEVWVDHDMQPGEWKFEHITRTKTMRGNDENGEV